MTDIEAVKISECIAETERMIEQLRRDREVPAATMLIPCDAPARLDTLASVGGEEGSK